MKRARFDATIQMCNCTVNYLGAHRHHFRLPASLHNLQLTRLEVLLLLLLLPIDLHVCRAAHLPW